MFVDASAIVALIVAEPDAESLADRLERGPSPVTSGLALFEAVLGITRIYRSAIEDAQGYVEELLKIAGIEVIEISEREAYEAIQAFSRYGKGRHRASLNMGDCFAYACAKTRGLALLFKGDDFVHTDIAIA
jgi:ribonuclease VapC